MSKALIIVDAAVMSKIYLIRGQKVMLDRDLADLYGVATKVLKQAVRRNKNRFPEDFMFEMSEEEFTGWRSQFVTSNADRQGLRYHPFCFTEQGVTMLSCILNSNNAIAVNIRVIRIFAKIREMVLAHKDIIIKLEQMEKNVSQKKQDINLIFTYLKQLLNPAQEQRRRIGYRTHKDND